jgi:hypothetical protein
MNGCFRGRRMLGRTAALLAKLILLVSQIG